MQDDEVRPTHSFVWVNNTGRLTREQVQSIAVEVQEALLDMGVILEALDRTNVGDFDA